MLIWPLIFVFFLGMLVQALAFNGPLRKWAIRQLEKDDKAPETDESEEPTEQQ